MMNTLPNWFPPVQEAYTKLAEQSIFLNYWNTRTSEGLKIPFFQNGGWTELCKLTSFFSMGMEQFTRTTEKQ